MLASAPPSPSAHRLAAVTGSAEASIKKLARRRRQLSPSTFNRTKSLTDVDQYLTLKMLASLRSVLDRHQIGMSDRLRRNAQMRLQVRADGFNAFNHANFIGLSTAVDNPRFGKFTSTRGARVVQFSTRLTF